MPGNVQYYCNLNKKNVRKREGAITRQKKNTQIQEFWGLYIESLLTCLLSGLHKLWYPGIRDRSTWGKFGAHGEHGDVFLFSNLGAL